MRGVRPVYGRRRSLNFDAFGNGADLELDVHSAGLVALQPQLWKHARLEAGRAECQRIAPGWDGENHKRPRVGGDGPPRRFGIQALQRDFGAGQALPLGSETVPLIWPKLL